MAAVKVGISGEQDWEREGAAWLAARKRRWRAALALLAILLAVAVVVGTAVGSVRIPPDLAVRILAARALALAGVPVARAWDEASETILLDLRLPRVLLAALVGAALAAAGAVYQGLFRNPLADPYFLGVSAGAALGATVAIVSGLDGAVLGLSPVPLLAFVGALAATGLVVRLAVHAGTLGVERLLLAGVAVSALLGAVISLLLFLGQEGMPQAILWLMGGLSGRGWPHVRMAAPYVVAGMAGALALARALNALALGEDDARSLGIDVERAKRMLIAAASMMAAAAAAASGLVGFVGLIVPHMMRLVVGGDHRVLLPSAALAGATMLVVADLVARTVAAPQEVPVGIVMALCGAPFFLVLLTRRRAAGEENRGGPPA